MSFFSAEQQARIEHISLDFLSDADVIAQGLKERQVTADYVFFYSYLQPKPEPGAAAWSNAEALVKVNCKSIQALFSFPRRKIALLNTLCQRPCSETS